MKWPWKRTADTPRLTKTPRDGMLFDNGTKFVDNYGTVITNLHSPSQCAGRPCAIHNPTDHPMRSFRLKIRVPGPWDIKPMHIERICPHGIGHPDPDDMYFHINVRHDPSMGVHGCDGCCRGGTACSS